MATSGTKPSGKETDDEFMDGGKSEMAQLCRGHSTCANNTVCCPCVMTWNSMKLYCFGCMIEYFIRGADWVLCLVCRLLCWCCCTFKDKKFPADASSIGAWKGKTEQQINREVEWKRAAEVVTGKERLKLFEDGIDIRDVAQGGLGDCWLISALCCMAENPGQ